MIQTLWILEILLRAGESVMRMAWVHWLPEAPCSKFVSRIWVMPLINQTLSSQCLRPSMLVCYSSGEKSLFSRLKAKGAGGTTSFDAPHTFERLLVCVHALFHNLNPFSLGFCIPALGIFVVDQLLSHFWLFLNLWTAACQASLSFTISQSLLKLAFSESVMLSNHLLLCCPLFLLPSILWASELFQWVSSSHQVTEVLELPLQHQFFQWIFRTDFL